MNWLYYLLEANLYLAVFYAFYRLFLHQETFYSINRYYLIISTFISFALPFFQVGYLNSFFPFAQSAVAAIPLTAVPATDIAAPATQLPAAAAHSFELSTLCFVIYALIAAGFLLKMIISMARIFHIFFTAKREKTAKVIYVELEGTHTAFSFFNILFINPNLNRKETVLEHEMVHINQNHTVDVIFFELVQIISWFNPITYFMKEDIKLVHEYIADELTTSISIQKHDYALFIIENSFGVIPNKLSNQIFNHSLIKRRIEMLNKEKSGGLTKFRLLLLIPLGLGLLLTSTIAFSKEYILFDLLPQKSRIMPKTLQETAKNKSSKDVKDPANIFYLRIAFSGKGVSKEMNTVDKRAVYINGRATSTTKVWGIGDFDTKKELSPAAAAKKYGNNAKYGAVEFTGSKVKLLNSKVYSPQAPPPPPVAPPAAPPMVKFPLPKNPPPAPPQVKFPLPKKPAAPPAPPVRKDGQNDLIYSDPSTEKKNKTVVVSAAKQSDEGYILTSRPTVTTRINGSGYKDVTYQTNSTKTQIVSDKITHVIDASTTYTIEGTSIFSGNRIQGDTNTAAKDGAVGSTGAKGAGMVFKGTPQFKIIPPPPASVIK